MIHAPLPEAAASARPPAASLRILLRRVGRALLHNKLLFVAIVVAAVGEAFFTKAPFLLLKPLLDTLSPGAPVVGQEPWVATSLRELMDGASRWSQDLLGLDLSGSPAGLASILGAAAIAVLCALPGAVSIYGVAVLSRYFATKMVVELRNEVASHLLKLPLRFYGGRRMGDLISNITTDTAVLHRAFTLAADHAVEDPLLILMNFVILVVWVPESAWLLALLIPLMALPMIRLGKKVHRTSSKSLAAMGDATESMNQMLSGIRTVKAFQLEDVRMAEFADSNARFLRRTKRMLQAKGLSEALASFAYTLGFAGLIGGMGWLVLSGRYTVGDLGVLIVPLSTTYTHVKRLSRAYNTLMESVGALDGIESILLEPLDLAAKGGEAIASLRGEVEMEGVSFAYGAEPVLRDVSFHVEPGQTVALVGPSGAGKSTTLDLLARFHDPDQGRVRIDGKDLRTLEVGSYRRRVAVVSQQPFVFNTSILENIRYGRPEASMDEVIAAARAAQIHDFIAALPEGYGTLAGERGCNLSGGQLQRITIARAILRDPAILFLDEATSSLDSESEQAVQKALENLMRGRTSFVIAHRLATTKNADLILVMDDGRIVERGRHDELMRLGGLYSRLSQLQQLE